MNVMYEQSYPHFYEQQQQLFISSFNCKPHIVTNSHRREDMYKKDLVCPIDKYSFVKQGKEKYYIDKWGEKISGIYSPFLIRDMQSFVPLFAIMHALFT